MVRGLIALAVALGLLTPALAAPGPTPAEDMIGRTQPHATSYEDTLLDLARDNGLGYVEIVAANPGIDPWVPGEGTKILLPTGHILPDADRRGLVINLAEHRLYYFPRSGAAPTSLPIGVGRNVNRLVRPICEIAARSWKMPPPMWR